MFTARATWNADELAGRLEITTRTLRRDVTRLRDLGYPIASTTGRYGGYELGAGGRLPPLLLDDDEAIAVSVALRELSFDADPTLGEAALSASTKLRQVLPEALRDRVDALGEVVVGVRQGRTRRRPGRRRADRASQPDGPGDVLPARRARPVHLSRRFRPGQRAASRTAPAGVARATLVSRRLRPRPGRLADVPGRPHQRAGRNRTPQHTAGNARRRSAGQRRCRRPSVRDANPRARACRVARRRHVHRAHRWRRRAVARQVRTRASSRSAASRTGLPATSPGFRSTSRCSILRRCATSCTPWRGVCSGRATDPAFRPADVVTPREDDDIET